MDLSHLSCAFSSDRVYNHIKPASLVQSGCDYMLFKVSNMPVQHPLVFKRGIMYVFLPQQLNSFLTCIQHCSFFGLAHDEVIHIREEGG